MADNDSSIIKPVESLQNIAGLKPTKRREERKRRQNLQQQSNQEPEQEPDESVDQDTTNKSAENENDQNTIDYCA